MLKLLDNSFIDNVKYYLNSNRELIGQKTLDFEKAREDGLFTQAGISLGDIGRILIIGCTD